MKPHETHKKVITRFPPSPTGNLHLGSFRTALFNYLYAKQHDGTIVLRMEDTDRERSKPEYEKNILECLEWLGLKFDSFSRQSERGKIYAHYISKLIAEDKAYISKEETTEAGKRSEVIRFRNPNKVINFYDVIRGEISFDTTELGDFVIAKSPEEPLYHLAVVVDDHEAGVTHVIRGDDHISNTPRQILIGLAIGAVQPVYAHIPLILSPDKSKLSKRKGAKSLTEYRDLGYLPEALINFMAMLGWNPGTTEEIFSLAELIKRFDLAQVQKAGAVFNEEKLRWLNKEYLKRKTHADFAREMKPFLENSEQFKKNSWKLSDELALKLVPVALDRISVYSDLIAMADAGDFDYFFETPEFDPKDLIWREEKDAENTKTFLSEAARMLDEAPNEAFEETEKIKELLWAYASENGRGSVLWPIRFALSGKLKSPDPFTLISILGKKESIKRLTHAAKSLT
jgi:glutamyl-tRNA synthetase